ncbi:MAG: BREX system ATP-binding domain-containing protein, partial [Acidobacteriota bacterium]
SRVSVNKETPLHDPVKLFQGAADSVSLPGRSGPAFIEIANQLVFNSPPYRDFERWANQAATALDPRFPASLLLFERFQADHEFRDQLIRFWAGGKLAVGEVRSRMRQIGETFAGDYTSLRDLAVQRFHFASRLIRAAGYSGWVLLIDEVELIGTYSSLQRAKSYVEISRLMNYTEEPGLVIVPVLAITDDFTRAVLEEKDDFGKIPRLMQGRAAFADAADLSMAIAGMRILADRGISLKRPDVNALDETYSRIRALYVRAYGWEPAVAAPPRREQSTPLRAYIRRWITEWDIRRLHPEAEVELQTAEWRTDYRNEAETPGLTGEVASDQSLIDDVLGDIAP